MCSPDCPHRQYHLILLINLKISNDGPTTGPTSASRWRPALRQHETLGRGREADLQTLGRSRSAFDP